MIFESLWLFYSAYLETAGFPETSPRPFIYRSTKCGLMAELKAGPLELAAGGVAGLVIILIASGIISISSGDVSHFTNLIGIGNYLVAFGVVLAVGFAIVLVFRSQSH